MTDKTTLTLTCTAGTEPLDLRGLVGETIKDYKEWALWSFRIGLNTGGIVVEKIREEHYRVATLENYGAWNQHPEFFDNREDAAFHGLGMILGRPDFQDYREIYQFIFED